MENFKNHFEMNFKLLSCIGITIDPEIKTKHKFVEKLPVFFTNIIELLAAIADLYWIIKLWSYDNRLIVEISTNLISDLNCMCKGFQLVTNVDTLRSLLSEMEVMWRKHEPHEKHRDDIVKDEGKLLLFCKIYSYSAFGFFLVFGLSPITAFFMQYLSRHQDNHTYDFSQRVFYLYYPFEINSMSTYFSVLFYEEWILVTAIIFWHCSDLLFIQLTLSVSRQFKILNSEIEYIFSHESDERSSERNIINFIKRYKELLRFCEVIKKIYSPIIFAVMLVSSLDICVNMFTLQKMFAEHNYSEASKNSFFLLALFYQAVVYCVYAEILTQQINSTSDAVYNCQWMEKNHKVKVYVKVFIMRSQIPFYFTGLGFFSINLSRLTWTFKTAGSFYMVLQATNEHD